MFDVVHDETRPFRVVLDNSEVRVLGTRFNIYRNPSGDTTVTVLEDTVQVRGFGSGSSQPEWVRTIHANEQIEYRSIGLMREPHATNAQNAVSWRSNLYTFHGESVLNVIDELERYTSAHRDPGSVPVWHLISGALGTQDLGIALKHLQDIAPIDVKESNGDFTVECRN